MYIYIVAYDEEGNTITAERIDEAQLNSHYFLEVPKDSRQVHSVKVVVRSDWIKLGSEEELKIAQELKNQNTRTDSNEVIAGDPT